MTLEADLEDVHWCEGRQHRPRAASGSELGRNVVKEDHALQVSRVRSTQGQKVRSRVSYSFGRWY
jgi:hypothetical protein